MKRIVKAKYTAEFRIAAAQQVMAGQKAAQVARDLGISEQTLHTWVKAAREGTLKQVKGPVVTADQMENARLRAELARTKMEVEILKKAAAYFAKESL